MNSPFDNLSGPGKPLKAEWRILSKCHDLRNLGEYEGDLNVDQRIVVDLIAACERVASKVDALGAAD